MIKEHKIVGMTLATGVAAVLIAVGLGATALAVQNLSNAMERQHFFYSGSRPAQQSVVSVGSNRFAVVEGTRITVVEVNSQGKVVRLDDVHTHFETLEPVEHRPNPVRRTP